LIEYYMATIAYVKSPEPRIRTTGRNAAFTL